MKVQQINTANNGSHPVPKIKKGRKRHPILKFIVVMVLGCAALTALALSPAFTIKRIDIGSTIHYTRESIFSSMGIHQGDNGFKTTGKSLQGLLTFTCEAAEQRIRSGRPYIKDVKVRYIPPGRVIVSFSERKPSWIIAGAGSDLLLDGEWYVLEVVNSGKVKKLPIIKGLEFKRFTEGDPLPAADLNREQWVNELMKAIVVSDQNGGYQITGRIDWIDVGDSKNITISMEDRLIVNIGNLDELDYRLAFLKEIITKKLRKTDRGRLDFTTGDNPDFMPEGI